jgi:hypothetical protein
MHHSLLTSFPVPGKKKRNGKRREKKQKLEVILGSQGVALPSPLGKDRAGLDPFHCYDEPPAETHEEWVYGGGGAQGLSGSSGPCFPRVCRKICGVLYGVLQVGIRHATTSICLFALTGRVAIIGVIDLFMKTVMCARNFKFFGCMYRDRLLITCMKHVINNGSRYTYVS